MVLYQVRSGSFFRHVSLKFRLKPGYLHTSRSSQELQLGDQIITRRVFSCIVLIFTAQLEIRRNLVLRLHNKTASSHMDPEEETEQLQRSLLSSGNHDAAAAAVFTSLHIAECSRCVGGGGRGREEGVIRRTKHHLQVETKHTKVSTQFSSEA